MARTDTPRPTLEDMLDAMAKGIRQLNASQATGPLAELRRLDAESPTAPTFHALLAERTPDYLFAGADLDWEDKTRRLARVAQMMAMKPDALRAKPLGEVLQAIGFSETRLAMLLHAQGATLDDLARRAARRIALSDEPLPYRDLGRLLVLSGRFERRAEVADLRIRVARDYQRAARRTDKAEASSNAAPGTS